MTQLLEKCDIRDYTEIAAAVAAELATTAVDRDRIAGIPTVEVEKLRQAGLLPLVVPRQYGGSGASWVEAFKVIQTLATADGSVGQLYANHVAISAVAQAIGTPAQAEYYYRLVAQNHLFWGNAINTRDTRLQISPDGEHFRANGIKSFGTGTVVADLRLFSAVQSGADMPVFFVIPKDREGIVYNDDWDNMGQRCTASGSYSFHNVLVQRDEILGPPPVPESAFPGFLNALVQLTKTYVYLGIAEGAFNAGTGYTTTKTRPWFMSGVERATHDPYILRHYGELWTSLQAAISLADRAAQQVQCAWDRQNELTHTQRGEVAIAISMAKAQATTAGLAITNGIFEVMGARSTAAPNGFDRYWRDLRTFTLHDPIDYKLRDIGNWVLNGEFPMVSQYS